MGGFIGVWGGGGAILEQGANLVQRDNGLLQRKSQRKVLMQCKSQRKVLMQRKSQRKVLMQRKCQRMVLMQRKCQRMVLMQCRDGGITYTFVELAPLMETHTQ